MAEVNAMNVTVAMVNSFFYSMHKERLCAWFRTNAIMKPLQMYKISVDQERKAFLQGFLRRQFPQTHDQFQLHKSCHHWTRSSCSKRL